ncbi:MAG: hypothetical protein AB7F23_09000 [Phycisphaerae bacterium]|jgi:hypothetical protein
MSTLRFLFLLCAALFMVGCAADIAYDNSPDSAPAYATFTCSKQQAMERFKDVLTCAGFSIEKYDEQAGYILTAPLRGSQPGEFWRKDNTTAADAAYASMQSIARIGEFNFTESTLTGEVAVKQLSFDTGSGKGVTAMNRMFSPAKNGVMSLDISGSNDKIEWLYKGRDRALENRFMAKFNEQE